MQKCVWKTFWQGITNLPVQTGLHSVLGFPSVADPISIFFTTDADPKDVVEDVVENYMKIKCLLYAKEVLHFFIRRVSISISDKTFWTTLMQETPQLWSKTNNRDIFTCSYSYKN